jgi:hypothetical protein
MVFVLIKASLLCGKPSFPFDNLGKASPKGINDTHLLPCSAAILDNTPDKMGDPGVTTISYLIGTQKFNQAL